MEFCFVALKLLLEAHIFVNVCIFHYIVMFKGRARLRMLEKAGM